MTTSASVAAGGTRDSLTPVQARLLEAFTPVDERVAADLGIEVAACHVADLCKRLSLAAEISAPGRGSRLLQRALHRAVDAGRLTEDIDALLMFGCLADDLATAQRDKARRAEIRQEIRHFDRIMDLDSLRTSRLALKTRREFAFQDGELGAAERLLVLVQERQMLSDRTHVVWRDLSASSQHLVTPCGVTAATMRRTHEPVVAAAATAESQQQASTVLRRLEALVTRHPVAVALALVDYEVFMRQDPPVDCVVASLTGGVDPHAEVRAAGHASWCLFAKDGHRLRLLDRGELGGLACGGRWSKLPVANIAIPRGARLLVAADDGRLALTDDLDGKLNRLHSHGRIDANQGLRDLLGERPFAWVRQPSRRQPIEATATATETGFAPFVEEMLAARHPLHLSIECGHVHADREVGEAQLRGLRTGSALVAALRERAASSRASVSVDVTPMVDDDHVLNRLRFSDYEELFRCNRLPPDDLILESSPLLRAIAHDVLRQALRRDGMGYQLELIGGNVYLEAPNLRLELIEDVRGDMRNGCVLFEVGLIMYRAARTRLAPVFEEILGPRAGTIHRRMVAEYDAAAGPHEREAIRHRFAGLYRDDWERVQATIQEHPLLDRYRAVLAERHVARERTVVLNVLEAYYRPQQEKVLRLGRLLDIELPLWAAFFSPYGHGLEWMRPLSQPGPMEGVR